MSFDGFEISALSICDVFDNVKHHDIILFIQYLQGCCKSGCKLNIDRALCARLCNSFFPVEQVQDDA